MCAGGRLSGYKGCMPGVVEEILIAIDQSKPIFLLGGFGGATAAVCECIANKGLPSNLTIDRQIELNPGYREMLEFASNRGANFELLYSSMQGKFKFANLNNGLDEDDNRRLFCTPFIDEIIHLIQMGLNKIGASNVP